MAHANLFWVIKDPKEVYDFECCLKDESYQLKY